MCDTVVDEFVGRIFGKNKQLTVLEWHGRRGKQYNKEYPVKCGVCSGDSELFGNGVFYSTKGELLRGQIPCGCSRSYRWSRRQYEVRVIRACEKSNLMFLGFSGAWLGRETKVYLLCLKDGNIWDTSIVKTVVKGTGCPECKRVNVGDRHRKDDAIISAELVKSGKFLEGTTFNRTNVRKHNAYVWEVTCPLCSRDKYVSAGLCTGKFTTNLSSLRKGHQPCRCSSVYCWTQLQQEFRIREFAESKGGIEFISFCGDYKGILSNVQMLCHEHGEWVYDVHSASHGIGCPKCLPTRGFNPEASSSVYALLVEGSTGSFVGYGVSGDAEKRLATHKRNLLEYGFSIVNSKVWDVGIGHNAIIIEKELKEKLPRNSQEVEGFKTEATYVEYHSNLIDFVNNMVHTNSYKV